MVHYAELPIYHFLILTSVYFIAYYFLDSLRVYKYQTSFNENVKEKGKAIPVQAWTGPEGSRSLRLSDYKTVIT
jgi:hypothetical protein